MKASKEVNSPIRLRCQRCFHEWPYGGKNPYFTLCPHCRTTVRINKNKQESLQSDQVPRPVQTTTVATIATVKENELPS